jgi:hypothetical protein
VTVLPPGLKNKSSYSRRPSTYEGVDSILKQIGFREQHGVLLVGRQYGQRYPPRGLTISPVRRLQHAGMAKKSGRRTHCSPGL